MESRLGLFVHISICIILVHLNVHSVSGKRIMSNPEFEGCLRDDDGSAEPPRGPQTQRSNAKPQRKAENTKQGQSRSTPKYNKQNEPKWEVHEKNLKYKPPLIDTGIRSSEKVSAKQLEKDIEQTDRDTLFEWYDYAYGLKELINLVEDGAKKCGCKPLGPPILDTEKRINHALNAVSNKLRYGTVHFPGVRQSSEEESSESGRDLDD